MTTHCPLLMRVSTSVTGCFSAESHVVELFEGHPVRVNIATTQGLSRVGGPSVTTSLPLEVAMGFVNRICEIVAMPERLMGGRSTTVYEATVEANGQFNSFRCSEIPQSEVLDALSDPRVNEVLKLKMRQSIVSGYHNPAYELNRVVEDFIAENVSNQSGWS